MRSRHSAFSIFFHRYKANRRLFDPGRREAYFDWLLHVSSVSRRQLTVNERKLHGSLHIYPPEPPTGIGAPVVRNCTSSQGSGPGCSVDTVTLTGPVGVTQLANSTGSSARWCQFSS